jgi:hypothetical protein
MLARDYRAMLKIEKALGTYKPISIKLTRSRRASIRKAWARTENLARAVFRKPRGKSRKSRKPTHKPKYVRKIARGVAKGQIRQRAPVLLKPRVSTARKRRRPIDDRRFQFALRSIGKGKGVEDTAKEIRVSRERLVRELESTGTGQEAGGRWIVRDDLRRRVPLYTEGKLLSIVVEDRQAASDIAAYMAAVGRFISSGVVAELAPFVGKSAIDVTGRKYPFETDTDALYRLRSIGPDPFESFYRIVI